MSRSIFTLPLIKKMCAPEIVYRVAICPRWNLPYKQHYLLSHLPCWFLDTSTLYPGVRGKGSDEIVTAKILTRKFGREREAVQTVVGNDLTRVFLTTTSKTKETDTNFSPKMSRYVTSVQFLENQLYNNRFCDQTPFPRHVLYILWDFGCKHLASYIVPYFVILTLILDSPTSSFA